MRFLLGVLENGRVVHWSLESDQTREIHKKQEQENIDSNSNPDSIQNVPQFGDANFTPIKTQNGIQPISTFSIRSSIMCSAYASDQQLLALATQSHSIFIVDSALHTVHKSQSQEQSLSSNNIISQSQGIVTPGGAQIVRRLIGHNGEITTLSFSPDARVIFSSSLDGTLCIWDIPTASRIGYVDLNQYGRYKTGMITSVDSELDLEQDELDEEDNVSKKQNKSQNKKKNKQQQQNIKSGFSVSIEEDNNDYKHTSDQSEYESFTHNQQSLLLNLPHTPITSLAVCAGADGIKGIGQGVSAGLSAVGLSIVTAHSGWRGIQLWKVAFDLEGSSRVFGKGRIERPLNNKMNILLSKTSIVQIEKDNEDIQTIQKLDQKENQIANIQSILPFQHTSSLEPIHSIIIKRNNKGISSNGTEYNQIIILRLATLSTLPQSFSRTLIHADIIASRSAAASSTYKFTSHNQTDQNDSFSTPSQFFLHTQPGLQPKFIPPPQKDQQTSENEDEKKKNVNSRILKDIIMPRTKISIFLEECVEQHKNTCSNDQILGRNNQISTVQHHLCFTPLLNYIQSLTPIYLNSAIRSLSPLSFGDLQSGNDLLNMNTFLVAEMEGVNGGRNYDLLLAVQNVFLKVHGEDLAQMMKEKTNNNENNASKELKAMLKVTNKKWSKMDKLFQTGLELISLFTKTGL
ncbi:MAG: hypothetical protein EZS28_026029 [Streblomastix strix]|uniref:WDR36/Utp21 C-terminal domain-containing protein n=1 Tax=Streblomastix strix TaxID=222440 RepID=A0A5J4V7J5_9EUKA|nr:MAG: hypothetical protein EZS28_026029 [Streblomastix strix]